MKIAVIGCGYVGSVTGAGFADLGHEITFADIDEEKVRMLAACTPPIYEKGLGALLEKNREHIQATTAIGPAVIESELVFICVGTPSREDGSIDLSYIYSAAETIGQALREKPGYKLVVVKSTVVPGTTEEVGRLIAEASGLNPGEDFGIAMNPEFLREGNAVADFLNPDRVVLGTGDEHALEVLRELYGPFSAPLYETTLRTAEMIKYTSNAFLATKISFANEIGNVCKALGIDAAEVFGGVGMDARISPAFFRTGIGFGGSCFPKDVRGLIAHATALGLEPAILRSVLAVNETQPLRLISLLKKHIPDLSGRTIGVLGLAFKPDTDDIRESRALPVVQALLSEGADVVAYDPKAAAGFSALLPEVTCGTPQDVLSADAVLILTEWAAFEELDYTGKIVIDGRRIRKAGAEAAVYEGVCWE